MLKKIAFTASVLALAGVGVRGQNKFQCGCTGDEEADVTRIEYQIPIEYQILRGDVPGNIERFVEYIDDIIEDDMFHGKFDLKKDHSKGYYRRDRSKNGEKADSRSDVPKSMSIKYRQSLKIGDYENDKYQNDLSLQMGVGQECALVEPTRMYEHVWKCKNEANVMADEGTTMCERNWDGMSHKDYLDDGGNGYTGRLEFDDDPRWGTDDDDAETMVTERTFTNFPYDCVASGLNDYYKDICRLFFDNVNKRNFKVTVDKDVINFVRDIEFEVNRMINGQKTQVSEGKLTWQVRFESLDQARAHDPTGRETELSVKADREKTMDGQWQYTVALLQDVIDGITKCGSPWIRYPGPCDPHTNPGSCPTAKPTEAPTHDPDYVPTWQCVAKTPKRRWVTKCPTYKTQEDCSRTRKARNNCEWIRK